MECEKGLGKIQVMGRFLLGDARNPNDLLIRESLVHGEICHLQMYLVKKPFWNKVVGKLIYWVPQRKPNSAMFLQILHVPLLSIAKVIL